MDKNVTVQYDSAKLGSLKEDIKKKDEELLKEICNATANNNIEQYNYLKQLQLQCAAELRLIKHIEDGFKDEFFIC